MNINCLTCGEKLSDDMNTFYATLSGYRHYEPYCKTQAKPVQYDGGNVHEQLARYRRATKLADVLQAGKITSEIAAVFTPGQWAMASAMVLNEDGSSGMRPPTDQKTPECVVALLRAREACAERIRERNQGDLVPHQEVAE